MHHKLLLLLPLVLVVHGPLAIQKVRIDMDRGLRLQWRLERLEGHLERQLMRRLTLQLKIRIDVHLSRHRRLCLVGTYMRQHFVASLA